MKKFLKIGRKELAWAYSLMFIGLIAAGCTSSKQYMFSPLPVDLFETEGANPTKEQLAIGDLVIVKFITPNDSIPRHEERIKDDGNITLPLIGAVKADGKTPSELQKDIQNRYVPDLYKHLSILVTRGQRSYYVSGQVRSPGQQAYTGATTVLKAIESAGGFTEFAARRRVLLTRTNGKKFRLDCRKAAQDASLDLLVYPGDKIEVPQGPPPGGISFD